MFLGFCASVGQAQSQDLLGPQFFESYKSDGDFSPRVWNAPDNPIFYDHPLLLRQYGFGVLGGTLAGALGFYIGNAFEGLIFSGHSRKGYLSFSGVRYEHSRRILGVPAGGPFLGGTLGMWVGSGLTAFFMGDTEEEQGSIWWTMAGGALTTTAALMLADAAGVQHDRGMLPFIPLVLVPSTGAVAGYQISRWFEDKKRRAITEPSSSTSPVLYPPRVGMIPEINGMILHVDALNLTF